MTHHPVKRVVTTALSLAMVFSLSTTAFAASSTSADASIETTCSQEFSQDMAYDVLKQYLDEKNATANSLNTEDQATMFWNGFAQFAVDNGYIDDTPEQRAGITVSAGRAVISYCSDLCSEKYPTASMFLKHSLQDNPSDLTYGSSTSYARQIEESEEFQGILDDAIAEAKKLDHITGSRISDSVKLQSTTDLLLSYRNIDYIRWIKRPNTSTNLWNMEVTFKDTYDFDSEGWGEVWDELQSDGLDGAIGEALTMAAEVAVDMGIIEEYEIEITVETDFRA